MQLEFDVLAIWKRSQLTSHEKQRRGGAMHLQLVNKLYDCHGDPNWICPDRMVCINLLLWFLQLTVCLLRKFYFVWMAITLSSIPLLYFCYPETVYSNLVFIYFQ